MHHRANGVEAKVGRAVHAGVAQYACVVGLKLTGDLCACPQAVNTAADAVDLWLCIVYAVLVTILIGDFVIPCAGAGDVML